VTLTLYDNPASSNALKVRFLLAELDLPYERVYVPFARPRPDWLTRSHPLGTIPALQDGDFWLGESNAILRYLAHRERRYDLYPLGYRQRALVDWVLDTWATEIRPALLALEMAALFYPGSDWEAGGSDPAGADPAAVSAALGPAEEALASFEQLVHGPESVLERFTIADCCVAPVLWRTYRLPMLSLQALPKLARLREALSQRPAFAAAGPVG
jgi:glutathione S-transferase